MNTYLFIKTIHILSSCVLLGTGIGIAFFMLRSYFSDNLHEKLYAARNTVLADYIFTFPAVFLQPITGMWMLSKAGYDWHSTWLIATYILYVLIGLCWLPVVWLQVQMKKMVVQAIKDDRPLPDRYNRYFRIWFILGWPAFASVIVIFFFMVLKPS